MTQIKSIGILGGGQLGKMFLQKALDFNLDFFVLDPDPECSCKAICNNLTTGSFKDYNTVYNFGKQVDLITIEIEHVNIEALEQLEKEGKKVFPQPAVLRMIQDKGLQKEFYTAHNIPTPPYVLVNSKEEIYKHSSLFPVMQKMRKGGYDGKGVKPLKNEADIKDAFNEASVLESFADIAMEISVIVARNLSGEIKTFPVVEMVFNPEVNLVDNLLSPARISTETEKYAEEIAVKIAEKLGIVGVLAVEMFITKKGEILVNEMAPRPHNSGHHSIEANITSQYEQHLRAIMNWPLGDTSIVKPALMLNLLGHKDYSGKAIVTGLSEALKVSGVKPHWYGKEITKPFRKMGHITITGNSIEEVLEKAEKIRNTIKVIA
jgi:5-(carboxyamino)imidazole ribonucleotide synthase